MKSRAICFLILVCGLYPMAVQATPCTDISDCSFGESCKSGKCVSEGGAQEEESDEQYGPCVDDTECGPGKVCIADTCQEKGIFCKSDADCGQYKKCDISVFDSSEGETPPEWGFCDLDATQISIDPGCASLCNFISKCGNEASMKEEQQSGSSPEPGSGTDENGDVIDVELEFSVDKCKLWCSFTMPSNYGVAELQATNACLQQNAASCNAFANDCKDELIALAEQIYLGEVENDKGQGNDNPIPDTTGNDDERGGCATVGIGGARSLWLLLAIVVLMAAGRNKSIC